MFVRANNYSRLKEDHMLQKQIHVQLMDYFSPRPFRRHSRNCHFELLRLRSGLTSARNLSSLAKNARSLAPLEMTSMGHSFGATQSGQGESPGVRARSCLNANVTLVLSVALLVVSLLVRSGTVAVAASAGNDVAAASFASHCATCHGSNGSGDTPVGKSVKIPDLRSPAIQSQSDAQLAEIIANGKGPMPPFKSSLSKDEIDAL